MLLFISNVFPQTDNASKYAAFITATDLQKHLTVIASDEMEGRETGTEGQRKAAAYIESQFKQLGLSTAKGLNGYQQFYPVYEDSMISSSLQAGNYAAAYGKDFLRTSNETAKFRSKKVIFAGYGIEDKNYDDYEDIDVYNKVVIFMAGEPTGDGKYIISGTTLKSEWSTLGILKKILLAKQKGASGALIINPYQDTFSRQTVEAANKRFVLNQPNKTNTTLPACAWISHDLAKKIFGASFDTLIKKAQAALPFPATDKWQAKMKIRYAYTGSSRKISASNVLGVIEGTDKKDEFVFLTGHYDHLGKRDGKIYYGADDDGSGTVGVIEMATAFAKAKAE